MTDAEIVKVLAERDGFIPLAFAKPLDYLSDRNALASVIGKMTRQERHAFDDMFAEQWLKWAMAQQAHLESMFTFCLTCDPRVIAGCVARAIHAAKGGG